tara:strand:+ start:224 stop:763 length:540 start_codon:yes stop_codon:yes gene_type:complete
MPQVSKQMRTIKDLTTKQKTYIDILVANWGNITKVDALLQAGYKSKSKDAAMVMASKLTNPDLNPHVCRYLEYRLSKEQEKYEKDKLRRYKTFERLRDGAEQKGQYTGAINAEFRSGQLAGQFVDKKEVLHSTLEGMSREQLENRLKELENKINDGGTIIDITPNKKETKKVNRKKNLE